MSLQITKLKKPSIRWRLLLYDALVLIAAMGLFLYLHPSIEEVYPLETTAVVMHCSLVFVLGFRIAFGVYGQIWRYGDLRAFMILLLADIAGGFAAIVAIKLLAGGVRFIILFSALCCSLLACIAMRIAYSLMYNHAARSSFSGGFCHNVIQVVGGVNVRRDGPGEQATQKIRVAIVGAGRLGSSLAEDMFSSPIGIYTPVCFFDNDVRKIGRNMLGLPVFSDRELSKALVEGQNIQEFIFTLPNTSPDERKRLYDLFKIYGCRVKVYDYPVANDMRSGRLQVRDFDIDELLLRRQIVLDRAAIDSYYSDKVILVTGGGGSIGSELCRQVALAKPKQLIVLDIAENSTYSLQLALKHDFEGQLDLAVEILSVTDRPAMRKIFEEYRPQVVLHAAAHKHVPLMEHNCVEAVKNNVFGTLVVTELCKEFEVEKLVLVSSDKAVNPTNVMGATKRMCEMIVLRNSFACAVRFGNVMGSAGSVIPLFKNQIKKGGPVTITDKRIIRYFMTIPEASRLILESGAKAKSGELFVLDMGEPVNIYRMAEDMIKLSGLRPHIDIEIVETGLRPGEKLYEELLMKSETLSKTDNDLIFVEKQEALSEEELGDKLSALREAVESEENDRVKDALKAVIPTYKAPEVYNRGFGGKE